MNNKTWWGEYFIEALASFIDEGRLSRGKAYCNPSRLSNYQQQGNMVTATMKGNINPYFGVHKVPYYKTKITFTKLSNQDTLLNNIAKDPLLLAKLVTRELPKTIASILPQNNKDIATECSCPDWDNPCKHIAGLYFKIAEEINYNPLLIFELRGVSREALTEGIKKYVRPSYTHNLVLNAIKAPEQISLKTFWGVPHRPKKKDISSSIPCVLIKKAGINPPFWYKKKSFIDVMDNIYKNARKSWKIQCNQQLTLLEKKL